MGSFCATPPLDGLGENPETIKRLLHDDPEALAAFESAVVGKHGGDRRSDNAGIKGSNPTLEKDRGKAYTLRRLAKSNPGLFDEVKAGAKSAVFHAGGG